MKVSRLKLLSVLCFALAFGLVITLYFKDYKLANSKIAIVEKSVSSDELKTASVEEVNIDSTEENTESTEDNTDNTEEETNSTEEVEEQVKPEIVYDGLTLEELSNKLDRTLSSTLADKGYLYASYSLERGVDPYLAVAISMEETGCAWGCSSLVVSCNNVGGMKGSGCGSYAAFSTIDEGIMAFIDNIANNYVAYGLTTADTMNSKYAENPMWASNVNAYIEKIKNR